MSKHDEIYAAVEAVWNVGGKPYIDFMVVDFDGDPVEGVEYPIGYDYALPDCKARMVSINLSVRACKYFGFVDEFKEFVYDVGVNGKGFFGNIPPHAVVTIRDMDNGGKVMWHRTGAVVKPQLSETRPDFKWPGDAKVITTPTPKTSAPIRGHLKLVK